MFATNYSLTSQLWCLRVSTIDLGQHKLAAELSQIEVMMISKNDDGCISKFGTSLK